MKEEYQSNASQLPTEIVHDIQYARFHEVSESDAGSHSDYKQSYFKVMMWPHGAQKRRTHKDNEYKPFLQ